jgi:hypothetical protein
MIWAGLSRVLDKIKPKQHKNSQDWYVGAVDSKANPAARYSGQFRRVLGKRCFGVNSNNRRRYNRSSERKKQIGQIGQLQTEIDYLVAL